MGTLRAVLAEQVEGADAMLHAAAERLDPAAEGMATVVTASARGEAHAAERELRAAVEGLGRASAAIGKAAEDLGAYIAAITGAEGETNERGTASAPEPPRLSGARLPFHDPRRAHPSAVELVRRHGWPTGAEGRVSARGHLYTDDGRRVNPVPYRAYRKGEQPYRPDLADAFNDPDLTTTWHAESDIAQAVRDLHKSRGTSVFALYLNIPPCGLAGAAGRADPKRCAENLLHIIPKDVVVYLHVISEAPTPHRRWRIVGTGEGIR